MARVTPHGKLSGRTRPRDGVRRLRTGAVGADHPSHADVQIRAGEVRATVLKYGLQRRAAPRRPSRQLPAHPPRGPGLAAHHHRAGRVGGNARAASRDNSRQTSVQCGSARRRPSAVVTTRWVAGRRGTPRRVTLHEPTSPETERPPGPGPPEGGAAQGRVVVVFHPRSILTALGVVLAVVAAVEFMLLAQAGLTLVMVALFLALALNPAVEFAPAARAATGAGRRRGLRRGPGDSRPPGRWCSSRRSSTRSRS